MIFLDIETNLAHDTIWLVVTKKDDEIRHWRTKTGLRSYLLNETVVGHNIIGFDAPVLKRVWGITIPLECMEDTLVISRLINPQLEKGHSLKQWGKRLDFDKMDFDVEDFDAGYTEDMAVYCERDVEVTERLYNKLASSLVDWEGEARTPLTLEYRVAAIMAQQERDGFKLNLRAATDMLTEFKSRMSMISEELQEKFPPIVTERYSEKTGKRLKDKVEVFNVGSRQQVAKRLQGLGVKFTKKTEKGSVIVDEAVLKDIDLPEAQMVNEYLMLQKRVGLLTSWLDSVKEDGRVHGRVVPIGAVTGRMTHYSPNMGQIPSVKSPYGKECRACWTVEDKNVLVGCDLSGIELRCLAHYMQDEDYTRELLDGDIHTVNQLAAGLESRDQAKTMIYGTLYGAGVAKIGQIVGGTSKDGQRILENFLKNTPKLGKLMTTVKRAARRGWIRGLDGRRVIVRSEHAALNSLLQSCGAIIAKQWLVEMHNLFEAEGIEARQVAMVHDEVQIECKPEDVERVSSITVQAAQLAGDTLNFRVRVDAEAKHGNTWYDTH